MTLLNTPTLAILATLTLFTIQFATLRLLSLAPHRRPPPTPRKRGTSAHLLIVLGSGGHTAEMISMLRRSATCNNFTHRTWLVSSGDDFSAAFAEEFEQEVGEQRGAYRVVQVRRARKIHQSLVSAPWSCLLCLWDCLRLLMSSSAAAEYGYPDLILTNGPATATILVFASVLLRFFGLQGTDGKGEMRTIYVESWARVKKLSLSGRLLCWVVDRVLVQWEQLQGAGVGGRAEFKGVLV
ncbi:Alg14-domain-containing protein [Aureobasidium sp. EXF-10727]|nr:Alg14-domain-containing protein [Aureobasidium sp. EXF-10727]